MCPISSFSNSYNLVILPSASCRHTWWCFTCFYLMNAQKQPPINLAWFYQALAFRQVHHQGKFICSLLFFWKWWFLLTSMFFFSLARSIRVVSQAGLYFFHTWEYLLSSPLSKALARNKYHASISLNVYVGHVRCIAFSTHYNLPHLFRNTFLKSLLMFQSSKCFCNVIALKKRDNCRAFHSLKLAQMCWIYPSWNTVELHRLHQFYVSKLWVEKCHIELPKSFCFYLPFTLSDARCWWV